jgi:hypothetical protein
VPQSTDDVLIPCEWTIKLDQAAITVNSLLIDGAVRFDEAQASTIISASYINIRAGKLAAGYPDKPFPGKI